MEGGGRVAGVDLSVVMPCLNEEVSIAWCVARAWRGIERSGLRGEVVVCDNGSVDRSVELARGAGARVVCEARRGYGRAYLTGIEASVGRVVVIGDSDYSYDFFELHRLVGPLFEGYDYVLGSRFSGTILPGAMPFLNRYLGNPVLTGLLNSLFGLDTSDAHSGMRAFTRDAFERMGLRCEGMEFASEIVIAAARAHLRVTEVPITYHPRLGHSKLRRWRDGARHVRFMLAEALRPRTPATTTPQSGMASEQPDDFRPGSPGDSSRTNGSLRPPRRVTPSGTVATRSSDTKAEYDPEGSHSKPSSETTEP
jgi:glycosyltransferase involved in cell wall biosynthesis